MDSKITRRVALGVIFGGLTTCPFVIRSLRREVPSLSAAEAPYGKFSVDPQAVKSDLSP